MKTTLAIFMAAIAVVHMEAQWPLLQPTVPYVYGTYPAYPQVRVIPRTNPVSPLTYGLCDDTLIELKFYTDVFKACDQHGDGLDRTDFRTASCYEKWSVTGFDVGDFLRAVDKNGDGRVLFTEFVEYAFVKNLKSEFDE